MNAINENKQKPSKEILNTISNTKKSQGAFKIIEKFSDDDFKKLSLKEQRTYVKKRQKSIQIRKKTLTREFSKSIIRKNKIVSYTNPYDDAIGKFINRKKYVIQINKICKSYFSGVIENQVLKKITFQLERGDFLVILGPSGSGKTTLLNILSGLDNATEGDVFVDGWNLSLLNDRDSTTFRRKKIGFVFQQYNLLPNLTAEENIEVGWNLAKVRNKTFVNNIIETIGIKEHIKKYPYQLSGGQQQRVSVARALAKNPEILFCDEPTGALDEDTGRVVLKILQKINTKFNTTIILVTHNTNIAKAAKKILKVRDGHIESLVKNNPQDAMKIKWM